MARGLFLSQVQATCTCIPFLWGGVLHSPRHPWVLESSLSLYPFQCLKILCREPEEAFPGVSGAPFQGCQLLLLCGLTTSPRPGADPRSDAACSALKALLQPCSPASRGPWLSPQPSLCPYPLWGSLLMAFLPALPHLALLVASLPRPGRACASLLLLLLPLAPSNLPPAHRSSVFTSVSMRAASDLPLAGGRALLVPRSPLHLPATPSLSVSVHAWQLAWQWENSREPSALNT